MRAFHRAKRAAPINPLRIADMSTSSNSAQTRRETLHVDPSPAAASWPEGWATSVRAGAAVEGARRRATRKAWLLTAAISLTALMTAPSVALAQGNPDPQCRAGSGVNSTQCGTSSTANGFFSTAVGQNSEATGNYTTALGQEARATGELSTALGEFARATGRPQYRHRTGGAGHGRGQRGSWPGRARQ